MRLLRNTQQFGRISLLLTGPQLHYDLNAFMLLMEVPRGEEKRPDRSESYGSENSSVLAPPRPPASTNCISNLILTLPRSTPLCYSGNYLEQSQSISLEQARRHNISPLFCPSFLSVIPFFRNNMFKTFEESSTSTSTQVKASVQRGIKSQVGSSHPNITEEQLDALLPKKPPLVQYKAGQHMMLYCRRVEHEGASPSDEPIFFQQRDGPILPSLKIIHKYPSLNFTSVTVDKGAIPYLLGGANVMCPGLTNPGGLMPPDGEEKDQNGFDKPGLSKGDGVVIYAEGKEHAIAIGVMTMSSAEM